MLLSLDLNASKNDLKHDLPLKNDADEDEPMDGTEGLELLTDENIAHPMEVSETLETDEHIYNNKLGRIESIIKPEDIECLMEKVETLKSEELFYKCKAGRIESILKSKSSWMQIVADLLDEVIQAPTQEDIACLLEKVKTLKSNKRISKSRADNIEKIMKSKGSWKKIVDNLFDEFTPTPRTKCKEGYKCRICEVPKRGHNCPYCEVCSTSDNKVIKKGHKCPNCHTCFDKGKAEKKPPVQLPIGKCKCKNEQT